MRWAFGAALRELKRTYAESNDAVAARSRAWKLFLLVPRMLLHRPKGTGQIGKEELLARLDRFEGGDWLTLLASAEAQVCKGRGQPLSRGARLERPCRKFTLASLPTNAARSQLSHWHQAMPQPWNCSEIQYDAHCHQS